MLWSELAIATLREDNHPLLVRAGYMRGREYLFLGQRALAKITALLRQDSALERCGVACIAAGDDLVAESDSGEEVLVRGANYAALAAKAVSIAQPPTVPDPPGDLQPEAFHTPGVKTIAQISAFTGLPATSQIKSLVMVQGGQPLLVLLRGDHQLSPAKLPGARQAEAEEIRKWFGADPGSLGPIGARGIKIIADEALRGRRNMIAGANRGDYHLRNVTPGEDVAVEFADLRQVVLGDTSITHNGPLHFSKVTLLDTPERILSAAAEQNRDADGLVLPAAIAPFTVVVTPVHPERLAAAREIYQRLRSQGHDALLDDRDARPGVKFKDADLIGFPYRINVGKKLGEGLAEVVERRSRKSTDVPVGEISIPH
ncbi:MAG: His/Gly/Thr/Pro-type tRNA ligase C-terminal domain-containing protein [Acidobacteriota bacterium]|nr:His/Gly/Thr/Pro-type tRNA ligase C-terminal domain-containing protein [Acidobacteriota bacterium]